MKPVIAMPDAGHDWFRIYMTSKYVMSLWRAGARVRFLDLHDLDKMEKKLLECDGLLLPGGGDIDPAIYGQKRHEKCGEANPLRDKGEFAMLNVFLPTSKPIFCICRGEQVLNVFRGGTMHQHIPGHSDFKNRAKGASHKIQVFPHTTLQDCVGKAEISVNSMHHQAVDKLGEGLTISAVSEDGIVEAVEITSHPFCLGVQWHPEHLSRRRADQQNLFDVFVETCRKQKRHL